MTAQAQRHYTTEAKAIPDSMEEILTATRARIAEEQAVFDKPFSDAELLEAVMGGELGDARLFSRLNSEKLSYDHAAGQWNEFSGHFWKEDEVDGTLARLDEIIDLYAGLARKFYSQMLAATKAGNKDAAKGLEEIEKKSARKLASCSAAVIGKMSWHWRQRVPLPWESAGGNGTATPTFWPSKMES